MFSLSDLSPQKEPFDLGDGRIIYFRNKQDFDLQELAAWERLRKTMNDVVKMRGASKNEQQHVVASQKSFQAAKEVISLVLPDLPGSILDSLDAGKVDHLASMCITVASGTMRTGAGTQDQLVSMAEKFPELPSEFLASLSYGQARLLLDEPMEETTGPKKRTAQPSKS